LYERFTDRSRRVIVLAQEESRMLKHNYIGTEHILLGLIHEGEGVAAKALKELNVSLEAARQRVEEIIGRGQAFPTDRIPFTPRAKNVLELALRESLQLGHNVIGTEHILLGLIREGEGVGAQVLQDLGAYTTQVRQTVLQRLVGRVAGREEIPTETAPEPGEPLSAFEERERIVLGLLSDGLTSREIADALGVSTTAVGVMVKAIVAKLEESIDSGDG
jgi:ATP-dependent Clp protease ATP-binding subunit ClpC